MAFGDDPTSQLAWDANTGQGGNVTQMSQGGGSPIIDPSLQQMYQGNFAMTANGPQFYQATGNPNATGNNTVSQNSPSDQFFGSSGANSPTGSRIASVQANPNNPQAAQYQNMMRQLMAGFNQNGAQQQSQYQQLLQSLLGKNGVNAQLQNATANYGAQQQSQLAQQQKNQTGALNQNLTSRGLGNTTIQNSALQGLNRNQTEEQQNLASNIAQQKMSVLPQEANIQMGAFNANPANAQQSQYLNLIGRLGSQG